MNIRTFVNLKKDITRIAKDLFPNGSPLYVLTQTGQTEKSEELLLKYYTLLRTYMTYFPNKEVRFGEEFSTVKEKFKEKCKRSANILENSKVAFRNDPVYIDIFRHNLTKTEIAEQLVLASSESNQALPENVIPVIEGNHFDVAYFIKDSPNCILFIKADTAQEYAQNVLKALDEALIYQLAITKKDATDEFVKELNTSLEMFKGAISDDLINKSKEILESKIMEISRDLYDSNLRRTLNELQKIDKDIETHSQVVREAIFCRKEQQRILDELIKQEGTDYSKALIILSRFDEFISIETDGHNIIFDVIGRITFDENLINDRFLRDSNLVMFFKDIMKGDINLKFASSITVDPIEGFLTYQPNRTDSLKKHLNFSGVTNNPHHEGYKCFGSYRDSIKTAISASNWIAVGLLILESACSLNLVDGAVFPNFRDNLKGGAFNFYYKGRETHYYDYLEIKKQEQKGGS